MRELTVLAFLCAAATAALSGAAKAEPSTRRYRALLAEIEAARRADPPAFAALASLKERVPELDRRKRGRLAALAPWLRAMGPRALMPMLAALASTRREELSGAARVAWQVGLLEAVGTFHDRRATPVLYRVLKRETDPDVVRAAAAALGAVGDDEAVALLSALAAAEGPRRLAVIAGMGECRRLAAARLLARLLSQRPEQHTAAMLCKALGELGSAWAWDTPRLVALKEGPAVRALAAQTLLEAFTHYSGAAREAAETAMVLVDAPQTPDLIQRARAGAPVELQPELARLADTIRNSPLRPKQVP